MTFQERHGWMGGSTEALGEVERMLDGVGQKFICDWRGVTFYKTVMEVNMAQVVKRKEWTRKELKKNKMVRRVFDDRCLTV